MQDTSSITYQFLPLFAKQYRSTWLTTEEQGKIKGEERAEALGFCHLSAGGGHLNLTPQGCALSPSHFQKFLSDAGNTTKRAKWHANTRYHPHTLRNSLFALARLPTWAGSAVYSEIVQGASLCSQARHLLLTLTLPLFKTLDGFYCSLTRSDRFRQATSSISAGIIDLSRHKYVMILMFILLTGSHTLHLIYGMQRSRHLNHWCALPTKEAHHHASADKVYMLQVSCQHCICKNICGPPFLPSFSSLILAPCGSGTRSGLGASSQCQTAWSKAAATSQGAWGSGHPRSARPAQPTRTCPMMSPSAHRHSLTGTLLWVKVLWKSRSKWPGPSLHSG
eukprot:scaffold111165_cov20-Tisochrysis_lutea.AAC.2